HVELVLIHGTIRGDGQSAGVLNIAHVFRTMPHLEVVEDDIGLSISLIGFQPVNVNVISNRDHNSMLVPVVDQAKTVKKIVASSVRTGFADYSDSLRACQLYQSILDSRFKSFQIVGERIRDP